MFNLPILIYQLAIADLRRLATDSGDARVRGKDIAVGRKLVSESFRCLRTNQEPDPDHIRAIREIATLALAFTTRYLESVQKQQLADPTYRLSSTDLAAMTLYQRALKLQDEILDFEEIPAQPAGVPTHSHPQPTATAQPATRLSPTHPPTPAASLGLSKGAPCSTAA